MRSISASPPPAELPPEIQHRIALFCARSSLATLARTNRAWTAVTTDVLGQTVRLTFDPVPEHARDYAVLRQLWRLAQSPVPATRVRVLGLSLQPLGWLHRKAPCSRCGPRTKTARCASHHQPIPPLRPDSEPDIMYNFAMRHPVRCRFYGVRNAVIAYAHICVALETCTNVVRVELPSLETPTTILCDRALRLICRLQHIQVVQLSAAYVRSQLSNPQTHNTLGLSPEFLEFIGFMTSRNTPDLRRLVIICAASQKAWTQREVNGLADYGVSAIGTAVGIESDLRIYPAAYRSAGSVSRYMSDVSFAFSDRPCDVTVVKCTLDPRYFLSMLPEVAIALSRASATIKHLYFHASTPLEGQRADLGDLPADAGEAGAAVMRALRPLSGSVRFIWLRRLGDSSTCWQPPFTGSDLRAAAEETWCNGVVIHEWMTG